MLAIEHIGSTSIPGMFSKPIVDIGVLLSDMSDAEKYIKPLASIGYTYFPESSSSERHFFRKGNPVEFHISLAYKDRGTFWARQISFRDYLRMNRESRDEYIKLKKELLNVDPTGGKKYINGKCEFVKSILMKSEKVPLHS